MRELGRKKDRTPLARQAIILAAGQVDVTLTEIASDAEFYINGLNADSRKLYLSEYVITGDSTITLAESYPAGTILIGEKLP